VDGFFFCFGFNPCFFILASAAAARSDRNFSRSASVRFGLIIGSGKSLSRFVAAIDGDVARCSSADPNRCPVPWNAFFFCTTVALDVRGSLSSPPPQQFPIFLSTLSANVDKSVKA